MNTKNDIKNRDVNFANNSNFLYKKLIRSYSVKLNIFIILCVFAFFTNINKKQITKEIIADFREKIYFDKYEVNKYNEIKAKLLSTNCSQMYNNDREFLNGIIRKFRPHKILEIGVCYGGSSIIMLNAINDFKDSKLYSIDLDSNENVGKCVYKYFPDFVKKWELFKGNVASNFMKKIGDNIDMVFIDTAHFEPGEILDFLIVLPFLKEGAIIIIHDIGNQITRGYQRNEWAPYIIFNGIRGYKYLPSGNQILKHDIGAIQLEKNQYKYYKDYFRLLGGQWQYFPKEKYINHIRNYFKKYYDDDCLTIFEETVSFNRELVKRSPKLQLYRYNSD